jgi:hypothetical protein
MESAVEATHKFYGEAEVAALIRTLDRKEDYHIFAEDVLKTYPYLAESYTKVCPRRCDLATATQKALEGVYSHDVKLTELKADIALMVSNCVAFNGPTSAYAETAAKFERFAVDQIDRFIVEHNGGRRPSRLRLPAASAEAPSIPTPASGKKGAAVSKKEPSSAVTAIATAAPTATTFVVPTTREVVQLVDSLNRREDGGAFSVDVAEAYPDLRESYQKVCPQPMNLVMMHQRAKEGYYTAATADAAPPLFGASVATSLTRLRDDVELLVHNCITFNAKVDSWVTLAMSFQAFAHRRIDDFVLRHATSLRGTRTGAQTYGTANADAHAVAAAAGDASAGAMEASSRASTASANTTATLNGRQEAHKRERGEGHGGGPTAPSTATPPVTAPASVKVVGEVVPQVCPTPLQPELAIPVRLRRRLALEHLRHTQLPLRRVGVTVPLAELYPPPPPTTTPAATAAASPSAAAKAVEPREKAAPASRQAQDDGDVDAGREVSSPASVTIDASCSVGHVVRQLQHAIERFFSAQRGRSDFVDAFAFSQREEQLYLSVLRVIHEQFEKTAEHLLLYEHESAELAEWTALRALRTASEAQSAKAERDQPPYHLSDHLHYLYLVRFLVQWPQLACLCCTSATPPTRSDPAAAGGTAARNAAAAHGSLRISRDQLKIMAQVAVMTQEFLDFIERLEESICGN